MSDISTTNIRVPRSLGYHLADVWLSELEGALEDESTSDVSAVAK